MVAGKTTLITSDILPLFREGEVPLLTLLRDALDENDVDGCRAKISRLEANAFRKELNDRTTPGVLYDEERPVLQQIVPMGRDQFVTVEDYDEFKALVELLPALDYRRFIIIQKGDLKECMLNGMSLPTRM